LTVRTLSDVTTSQLVLPIDLFVYLSEPDSRRWLEREIDEAILDARETELGDRLPCPGCGGPVVEAKAERHEGGLECSHCGTGLVRTRGGIAMPPVRIDNRLGPASKTKPPRPRRERDTLVWSAPPWCRTYPIATPFNVLGLILFDAAVIGGSAWMVWSVPVFKIIAGGVAFGLSLAALGATRSFFANVFGRNTFRLGALYLEHEIRIGPWRYERQRIPLSRVLHLDARLQTIQLDGRRVEGSAVELELKLATHSVLLEPFGRHVVPMVREVVEAVPQRLTAMGRSVVGPGGKEISAPAVER